MKVLIRYCTSSMLNYTKLDSTRQKDERGRVFPILYNKYSIYGTENTLHCTVIFSKKYLILGLSCNRTLKSGQRRWSITLLAVVNSPVTAPFPSMPGRSGAWSPVWRRSLLLMILANPAPPYCNRSWGSTTEVKPWKRFHCVLRHYAFTDPLTASVAAI